LLAVGLTVVAMSFVTVRFFAGAASTLSNARESACRSLTPDPIPAALQNVEAPNFELPDAQGRVVSLRAQRGHPVAVNFWATWCPPCVEEMPQLADTWRKFAPAGFETLAVSMAYDPPFAVANFAQSRRLPFGVVIDNTGEIA